MRYIELFGKQKRDGKRRNLRKSRERHQIGNGEKNGSEKKTRDKR